MKLYQTQGWQVEEELVSAHALLPLVSDCIRKLDWSDFASVRLEQSENCWLSVSGNHAPDGFSIVLQDETDIYVSAVAPESLAELEQALAAYYHQDWEGLQAIFDGTAGTTETEPVGPDPEKFKKWQASFKAQQKIDRRRAAFRIACIAIGMVVVVGFMWLWWNDDLQFVGHDTQTIKAAVIDTTWQRTKGGYYQYVYYQFYIQGQQFEGSFRGTKLHGVHYIGDAVEIEYAVDDPTRSKYLATFVDYQ